jgi:excisionase family DNA binding protein
MPSGEELVAEGLLSIAEAVRFLRISRSTLYELMESGRLQYVKLGRSRRVPRRALVALAAGNLRGGWRSEVAS